MRPIRLDLAGFTAFREETVIDFTDADFFVLLGPTGSGKSTVLDAICFALYGTVPRWDHLRSVENALSPSAGEARVRLVFESAGRRYVASRVLKRSARGRVSTVRAGLERLAAEVDLSALDDPEAGELGEVLAGTPSEMTTAVPAAVGLPYEQFTTCVVLPQGEFAEFLHAKPAKRQEILVNLLGLKVYQRIAERSRQHARTAESDLRAVDALLERMPDATEQAVTEAAERVGQLRGLAEAVSAALPELTAAGERADAARAALDQLDAEGRALAAVRAPDGVSALADAAAADRDAARRAAAAVEDAERREEDAAAAVAGAADAAGLRAGLDRHAEHARLVEAAAELAGRCTSAEAEATDARRVADEAESALAAAEAARATAGTAETAAVLRAELVTGQACPVCDRPVTELPGPASAPGVAETAAAAGAARRRRDDTDREARRAAGTRDTLRRQHAESTRRCAELERELADIPDPDTLRARLGELDALRAAHAEARAVLGAARRSAGAARTAADDAQRRLHAAWRDYDAARDAVSRFGPPAADRDDLAASWRALADWAGAEADSRRARRSDRLAAARQAAAAAEAIRGKLDALLDEHGVVPPAAPADASAYRMAAALAVQRAEGAYTHAVERFDQAEQLRARRDGHARDAQLAKALAAHLAADRFQRWLLSEAMDLLVDGATEILRQVSGGQYGLSYDNGEFFVVDHHDADLARAVRTLSGGETFQASLALALALSEQLAGLSSGSASLESIMLDEGFGTLDPGTLDTVAATLENLAARGDRMVGLVTHVAALAERIPVRFVVRKDGRGAHVTREDA